MEKSIKELKIEVYDLAQEVDVLSKRIQEKQTQIRELNAKIQAAQSEAALLKETA